MRIDTFREQTNPSPEVKARRTEALKLFFKHFIIDQVGPAYSEARGECEYIRANHPGCAIGVLPEFKTWVEKNGFSQDDLDAGIASLMDRRGDEYQELRDLYLQDLHFYVTLQNTHDVTLTKDCDRQSGKFKSFQHRIDMRDRVYALAYQFGVTDYIGGQI